MRCRRTRSPPSRRASSRARWFRWTSAQAGEGKLGFTVRKPIGVVGAISPFNFPCNLVAHKLAPALAAGCAVVLKPASQTPLSALLLAELEEEAGLPAGWLSVVVGKASEIGDVLVEDERVKLITFTGSGDVGWSLQERAPRKRIKLELGNSTPVIVAADADLDAAAAKLAANAFSFAGQSCISVQRIYVERSAFDEFVQAFLPKVEALKVGDPSDDETDVGPVIDDDARSRIGRGSKRRARAERGARRRRDRRAPDSLRCSPTSRDDQKVSCDEVFGPVVIVNPSDSVDEAIERANGTRFGLQAGVFTASLDTALRAADAARVRRRHRSTRRRRSAATRCRTAASRRRATRGRAGLGGARDDGRAPRRHPALSVHGSAGTPAMIGVAIALIVIGSSSASFAVRLGRAASSG